MPFCPLLKEGKAEGRKEVRKLEANRGDGWGLFKES